MEYQYNGVTMHYIEEGEGSPLLLLHGWGCSTEIWVGLRPQLARRFRVISVDFPGFGQSGFPGDDWSMAEYAGLIADFIGEKGLNGCHVLAHSFGGRVVLKMAESGPLPFGNILLTGAAGIKPPSAGASGKAKLYKGLKAALRSGAARAVIGEKGRDRLQESLIRKFGSADYKALNPSMRGVFVRVINEDLAGCAARIDRPTLLIWGADDAETPLWMGEQLERDIADSGLVVLPAGHYAFLDRSADFLRIANHFFGG